MFQDTLKEWRNTHLWILMSLSLIVLFGIYRITLPSPIFINIGTEGDQRYLRDFNIGEQGEFYPFRWTTDSSYIKIPHLGSLPLEIVLAADAARPEGQPLPRVSLTANRTVLADFTMQNGIQAYQFLYHPSLFALPKDSLLEVKSDTFAPPGDYRSLGVLLNTVEVKPILSPLRLLQVSLIASLMGALSVAFSYLILRWLRVSQKKSFVCGVVVLALLGLGIVRQFIVARFLVGFFGLFLVGYALAILLEARGYREPLITRLGLGRKTFETWVGNPIFAMRNRYLLYRKEESGYSKGKRLDAISLPHPFLLAIYPILYLYAHNIDLLWFSEVRGILVVTLAMTLVLLLVFGLVFQDSNKAGFLTSAIVILFFSYGAVYRTLQDVTIRGFTIGQHDEALLSLWGMLLIVAVLLAVRKGNYLRPVNIYLNVVGVLLVAMPLVNIGFYTVRTANAQPANTSAEDIHFRFEAPDPLPDIYYIILDAYPRADILRDYYSCDNSEFIDYLTAKGFYVPPLSRSNYAVTLTSLASSLNMKYLNYLKDEEEPDSLGRPGMRRLKDMVRDNKVARMMKAIGYRYVWFSSGHGAAKRRNELADINYEYGRVDEFRTGLLQTTVLGPFMPYLSHTDAGEEVHGFNEETERARHLYNFEKLEEIPRIKEPTFTFAHLVIPHSPYVFDRDGNPVHHSSDGFVDQLIYLNKRVEAIVDKLLAESDVPPIIILQADHGLSASGNWESRNTVFVKTKMGIFNAYYLPEVAQSQLYPTITPVNSFRLLLDSYFGTDLGLLEDKSYLSNYEDLYDFCLVPDYLNSEPVQEIDSYLFPSAVFIPPTAQQSEWIYDGKVKLLAYEFDKETVKPGDTLQVNLYWQVIVPPVEGSYHVSIHLLGDEGKIISQDDGPPHSGEYPTDSWSSGEILVDARRLSLDEDVPPGTYRLEVGFYNSGDRVPLPVSGPGEYTAGAAYLEPVIKVVAR